MGITNGSYIIETIKLKYIYITITKSILNIKYSLFNQYLYYNCNYKLKL